MRKFTLFIICFVALYTQAQDFVIGGQAKSSTIEKYDSLSNFYFNDGKKNRMIGQEFTYYNSIDYASYEKESQGFYQPPYPWKDGRVRSGRYTSSRTAKDAYLAELKRKSGTKYKLAKYVTYENKPGIVFSDEKGDSILYPDYFWMVGGEFICEGYKEKFRSTYVGKDVFFVSDKERPEWNPQKVEDIQFYYIGVKSRQPRPSLPYMSKWTVKGLGVDTTYWGDHTKSNDQMNLFCRLVFVVHNEALGDYECWVSTAGMLGEETGILKAIPKFILADSILNKPRVWEKDYKYDAWTSVPTEVLSAAKDGNPSAMYAVIQYYYKNARLRPINDVSYDDYVSLLEKAVDGGYIHNSTSFWLYKVATHYITSIVPKQNNPHILWDKYDEYNNYEKGVPFLIKSARLGNEDALDDLIMCYESGKTKSDEAYRLIEERAKYNHVARLYLGRRLLQGGKIHNTEQLLDWLQQTSESNSSEKSEASQILSECYERGIGVHKDSKKTLELLTKAADNNNQEACFKLGEMYYLGNETEKDWNNAALYINKGINLERNSHYNIDFRYFFMLGKILASKSDMRCLSCFKDAFTFCNDNRRYEAALELGSLYYEGKVVEKNDGEAAEYYWLAYKDGKQEEGKRLFEKYQLKDKLINYLNEQKAEGNCTESYYEEMIQSLSK